MDPNNPYQGPRAALLDTPPAGEATVGTARRRPVGHGWLWWKRSWSLVATNWVLWCLAVLVFFAVLAAISLVGLVVPRLGSFAPTLFSPLLSAGLLHLAWRRWDDEEFEFGGLFAGFSNRTGALFFAGLMQLVLQVGFTALLALLAALLFGADVAAVLGVAFDGAMPSSAAPAGLGDIGKVLFGVLTAALFAPYLAMLWFQAPLVYFGQRNGFKALGESLVAVLKNWAPMLWLSMVTLVVLAVWIVVFAAFFMFADTLLSGVSGILAMILLGFLALVSGLFLMAVMTVSVYASFRDIFATDDDPEATPEL
ncbi:MAG TPA: BPSS1780 family membrane protein [Alcanivorax sp.]|nr:BPSS1780 family membrane protein [Alcanivorax sp.]